MVSGFFKHYNEILVVEWFVPELEQAWLFICIYGDYIYYTENSGKWLILKDTYMQIKPEN
jgi:hypothetical protein